MPTRPTIAASDSGAAPVGRRERNKQEKFARIVAAAKELFAAKGFAQTTTQEIAEQAEIGAGTLFLYAKSKEDLLVMVFKDEMIETSQAAFERVSARSPLIEQLVLVFGGMIDYHDRDVGLAKALIKEVTIPAGVERRHHIDVLMRVIYRGIEDLIESGQRAGRVREDVDTSIAAENLFAIYYFGLIAWLGGHLTKREFTRRLRARLSLVIEGLGVQPASGRAARLRKGRSA